MNRYEWNRALIEPFVAMSLKGIAWDDAAAMALRATIEPEVWCTQAAVDELTGVTLPDSTIGLIEAAASKHCMSVQWRKRLAGYKAKVPLPPEQQTARRKNATVVVPPATISWALARELRKLHSLPTIERLEQLSHTDQTPSVKAEIASLLGRSLNVESPDQVIEALDRFKLPAKFVRGQRDPDDPEAGRTVNEEALLELFIATQHPLTKAILEARSKRTALSYLDSTLPDEDGCIRCSFSNPGSETGRVLTRTWHSGRGGNLQATSADPFNFRRLMRARAGHKLAQCDLKGADGWTVAARCAQLGDPTMLLDLQAGVRIPSLISLLLDGHRLPEDRQQLKAMCKGVVKDWKDYALKKGQHLSNYMGSAALIRRETVRESWSAGELRDPGLAFCENVQRVYLKRYRGLQTWWNWVEAQVRRDACLHGASGQRREFMSRRWSGSGTYRRLDHASHKEAVASEPQMVTTYATNLALWRLWTDPANRDEHSNLFVAPLLHIHDALLVEFADYLDLAWVGAKLAEWFLNPITVGSIVINIPVEMKWGPNWGECSHEFPF